MGIKHTYKALCLTCTVAFLAASTAPAAIISTSVTGDDQINILSSAPGDVTEEHLTGNANASVDILRIFQEQSGLALSQPIDVDIDPSTFSLPRTFTGGGSWPPSPGVDGTVASGTRVDVFFFHLDEPSNELGRVIGSVTFDVDILGVITDSDTLVTTHSLLGYPGTTYPLAAGNHGTLEDTDDYITFTSLRTLEFKVSQLAAMDQFRVLTVVPAPPAVWLLGSGLIGLVGFRRKFKRA